jgi:hypothetical protein
MESTGYFLGVLQLIVLFLQTLLHLALHAFHEGDFLVESGLESVHLLMLLLLLIVLAGNTVKFGVHLTLVTAAGVLAEEGLISRKAHQIKL